MVCKLALSESTEYVCVVPFGDMSRDSTRSEARVGHDMVQWQGGMGSHKNHSIATHLLIGDIHDWHSPLMVPDPHRPCDPTKGRTAAKVQGNMG